MCEIYTASSSAPVNIAVLKYWGKRDTNLNLPTNSSISVTLSQKDLRTLTTVNSSRSFEKDSLYLNGVSHSIENDRTTNCLEQLRLLRQQLEEDDPNLPKLSQWKLHIISENNFPTAAGLASSAAGFAAMVAAISKLYELPQDASELSRIARKGSGSACRSMFGGYVAWEMGKKLDGSDSKAVQIAPPEHWPNMKAAICIVSDLKKDVSSTSGMQTTVQTSELFQYRVNQVVPPRYSQMVDAIKNRDFETFGTLTMKDSNSFHATCLDSYPPIFYLTDTSKKIIKLIHTLNNAIGKVVAAYTFDAGPNAVIYYESENEEVVLGVLFGVLSNVDGWNEMNSATLKMPEGVPLSSLDSTIASGVSRVILTQVGEGPKESDMFLVAP
ncbi:diphosphomevalonate decarboxylase [Komagataella kurtzmanii]|nr:diphosphomevalonate decarboxylase [Komagataella kurtzmanii]